MSDGNFTTLVRWTKGYLDEAIVNGTLLPGTLVETDATGSLNAHSTADGDARATFLTERLTGASSYDEAYLDEDTAEYLVANSGDRVLARVANAQALTEGSLLSSNGDGQLKIYAPGTVANATQPIVAISKETVTTSADQQPVIVEIY